jgi:hypothetical protein
MSVGERIENEHVAELAESLAAAARPTPAEIRHAMFLAYKLGKCDGGIELADRLLADEAKAAA